MPEKYDLENMLQEIKYDKQIKVEENKVLTQKQIIEMFKKRNKQHPEK